MAKPTKLPKWVFDNLEAYGNCALPNECLEWDREELKRYLENHTGEKIKLREAKFNRYEENSYRKLARTEIYLVAEIR